MANNAEDRFRIAFKSLDGVNVSEFCREAGCYRADLYQFLKQERNKRARVDWFTVLAEQHGISAEWLLTGKGDMRK